MITFLTDRQQRQSTKPAKPVSVRSITSTADRIELLIEQVEITGLHLDTLVSAKSECEAQLVGLANSIKTVRESVDADAEYEKRVNVEGLCEVVQCALYHAFIYAWNKTISGEEIGWRFSILDKEKELQGIIDEIQEAGQLKRSMEKELRDLIREIRPILDAATKTVTV